jgi:hypothetical protein
MIFITTRKQYLKMEMKLERIDKGLEFNQSDWLKVYTDFNKVLRTKVNSDFLKDFSSL